MAGELIFGSYPCAEAERGKFATISQNWLSSNGYYLSGPIAPRGRYAVLTYQLNSPVINVSGVTITISAINIDEPVTIDYIQSISPVSGFVTSSILNTVAVSGDITISNEISAYVTNWITSISAAITNSIETTITNIVSTIEVKPDTTVVLSTTLDVDAVHLFSNPVGKAFDFIEIRNQSLNKTVFFLATDACTYDAVTGLGLPIDGYGYYTLERTINNFVLATNYATVDVRVFGHYKG